MHLLPYVQLSLDRAAAARNRELGARAARMLWLSHLPVTALIAEVWPQIDGPARQQMITGARSERRRMRAESRASYRPRKFD